MAVVLCAASVNTLQAEELSETQSRIRELEVRIAEIEAELKAVRDERGPTEQANVAELQRRIDLLAAELEKIRLGAAASDRPPESRYGLGPAASRVYGARRGVSIGGYGEALFEELSTQNDAGEESGKKNRFDFLRAVLYFGYKFTDKIVFNSEIEFEHASTGEGGEVSVEFAYLDFLLSEHANIRAGALLLPVGFINELHEPPVYLGARRPEVERRIIPTTWRENGIGVFGDAGPVSYRAYVLAGFDSEGFSADESLRGGRQDGSKSDAEDLAFAARVDYTGVPGLLAGGSYYSGDSAQGREAPTSFDPNDSAIVTESEPFDARVRLYDLHVEYRARGMDLRGLYARGRLDDAKQVNDANGLRGRESLGERFEGWYLQAGYDLLAETSWGEKQSLIPYVRFEALDTQDKVPDEGPVELHPGGNQPRPFKSDPANDLRVRTYGVAYKPIFNLSIKLDYSDFDNKAETGVDQFSFAIGYLF
jgi:hypothetical protein